MNVLDYSNLAIGIVLGFMAYFDYKDGRMKYFYVSLFIGLMCLITFLLGVNYG
jgi:hypothetical protein